MTSRGLDPAYYSTIDVNVDRDGVCVLTLNRPEAMNAADAVMHRELADIWDVIDGDDSIRCVVMTGAGRAFSAGGDFPRMIATQNDQSIQDEVFEEARRTVIGMLNLSQPIIAAVNGPAVGLGASLVCLADLAVASEKSFLSDPHLGVGLVPADGAALMWPLMMGLMRAKEYVFTGKRIPARTALEFGLVTTVVAPESVLDEALELARTLCAVPVDALRETKRIMASGARAHVLGVLDDAIAAERRSVNSAPHKSLVADLIARTK